MFRKLSFHFQLLIRSYHNNFFIHLVTKDGNLNFKRRNYYENVKHDNYFIFYYTSNLDMCRFTSPRISKGKSHYTTVILSGDSQPGYVVIDNKIKHNPGPIRVLSNNTANSTRHLLKPTVLDRGDKSLLDDIDPV